MEYSNIKKARFISRPNRFIANVEIDGKPEIAHVKNTGRCRELLIENAEVYVWESDNEKRKTKYDLIAVRKGSRLINIDSQAPNRIFYEWLLEENLFKNVSLIQPEKKYMNSRFDFYVEADGKKVFVEVKGVTLEEDGIARFPDAPTERGIKHLRELVKAKKDGFDAWVVFIVQMENAKFFEPNYKTHRQFGLELEKAANSGVNVLALECEVTEKTVTAKSPIPVRFGE